MEIVGWAVVGTIGVLPGERKPGGSGQTAQR
jgi:hypothetical protein